MSLGQAIIVTIFSMGIVFLSLLAISYILDVFRFVFYDRKNKVKKDNIIISERKQVNEEINTPQSDDEDEELISVITAAVAASLSRPTYSIKIRKIKRISQNSSPWVNIGRQELMN